MMSEVRPLVRRALARAGLLDVAERVLAGEVLAEADLATCRAADVLAVAALADLVRERRQGDDVVLIDLGAGADPGLEHVAWARPALGTTDGPTGLEALREVALVRLATPAERPVAVSFDALGEGLAQAALTFGASVLVGTMTRRSALPMAQDAESATKKAELLGRVERAGRRARWGVSP
jgi:2-iminoacetate synthase ThiH